MLTKDKILSRLAIQAKIEGETENIRLCRIVADHAKTAMDWQSLVTVKFHRYGKFSYEAHHFYYVKEWVVAMSEALTAKQAV